MTINFSSMSVQMSIWPDALVFLSDDSLCPLSCLDWCDNGYTTDAVLDTTHWTYLPSHTALLSVGKVCFWDCVLFLGTLQTESRLCKLRSAVEAFLSDRDRAPLGWPVILVYTKSLYRLSVLFCAWLPQAYSHTHTYLACRVMWPGGIGLHR